MRRVRPANLELRLPQVAASPVLKQRVLEAIGRQKARKPGAGNGYRSGVAASKSLIQLESSVR